jgi:hypothetical protein
VPGVEYVDVDLLDTIDEEQAIAILSAKDGALGTLVGVPRVVVHAARLEDGVISPAQLAYLQPQVPETLILNEVKS